MPKNHKQHELVQHAYNKQLTRG